MVGCALQLTILYIALTGPRQPTIQSRSLLHDSLLMLDAVSPSILHVCRSSPEETESRATLCKPECSVSTDAPANRPSCCRKRKRNATEEKHLTIAPNSPQPPWKRPFQSRQEASTAYWDSLSKLWLTRRALKELHRRNRQTASPVRTGIIRRPDRSREPAALEDCPSQLKRFARLGGPDLRDLRGVNSAYMMS